MKRKELFKELENIISTKVNVITIRVNHIKTVQPTALNSIKILKEKDNSFTCIKISIVENIKIKNVKTLKGLKKYLTAIIKDYQQRIYTPIEFIIIY